MVCKSAHGEANKVVADVFLAAQTAAPTPARPPQRQRPAHTSVAMAPLEILHQAGVSIQAAVAGSQSTMDEEELPTVVIALDVGLSA